MPISGALAVLVILFLYLRLTVLNQRCIFLVVISMFSSSFVYAQHVNFKHYNTENGLPHSQISSICQDNDDYIWFSTYGSGVAQFNGSDFKVISTKDGLTNNICREIIQDRDGVMWIATVGGGVNCIKKDSIYAFGETIPYLNHNVFSILATAKNDIWMGTASGAFRYDRDKIDWFNDSSTIGGATIIRIFEDREERIWICAWGKGIGLYENDHITMIDTSHGLLNNNVMSINQDKDGSLWIGTFSGLNHLVFKQDTFEISDATDSLMWARDVVYGVHQDRHGDYFIATNIHGVEFYDSDRKLKQSITHKNGLPGDVAFFMFQDNSENLWVSLWGAGVIMFDGDCFIHFTKESGFPTRGAVGMMYGRDYKEVATAKGVVEITGESFSEIKTGLEGICLAMYADSKGGYWYGFDDGRIIHEKKDGKREEFDFAKELVNRIIRTASA